jgi:hypothetical protein
MESQTMEQMPKKTSLSKERYEQNKAEPKEEIL